jgi:hypothetical protein
LLPTQQPYRARRGFTGAVAEMEFTHDFGAESIVALLRTTSDNSAGGTGGIGSDN